MARGVNSTCKVAGSGESAAAVAERPAKSEMPEFSVPVGNFSDMRSVRWRVELGVLPADDCSVEELRRVTADTRRRYASLRRRLLVDPHVSKDEIRPLNLAVDNPLSQNPDSMWGQFFKNAELERVVDQDLSRLYPEKESSYFQTVACQAILRRILLLWTLKHPDYGYRQGMHELLAPLLYVLHVDVQHLTQVRELYQDAFIDKFDDASFADSKLIFSKESLSPNRCSRNQPINNFHEDEVDLSCNLDDLEPDVKAVVLLNDAYGAEGELGVLLSEKFMEHDAYCMFDALMSGANGMVAVADFFSPLPTAKSLAGLPSVIEASLSIYHLLSIVDSSLHTHLVELGVEPQYFSMRWLRVLYGREFSLENLLVIWDEIFASSNVRLDDRSESSLISHYDIFNSARGSFIVSIAVAMLLHLRSSLLATEHATFCLQRLLNFPEKVDLKKLIEKAKLLQGLALDSSIFLSRRPGFQGSSKSSHVRNFSSPSAPMSPRTSVSFSLMPDSYWEEKWRVLHKEDELHKNRNVDMTSSGLKAPSSKGKSGLSRTVSTPVSTESSTEKTTIKSSIRRNLIEEFSGVRDEHEVRSDLRSSPVVLGSNNLSVDLVKGLFDDLDVKKVDTEDECCSVQINQDDSSAFSSSSSPSREALDHETDQEERSSGQSKNEDEASSDYEELPSSSLPHDSSIDEGSSNDEELPSSSLRHDSPIDDNKPLEDAELDLKDKQGQERKAFPGRFSWFLRFGRRDVEGPPVKGEKTEVDRNHSAGAPNLSRVSDVSNADSINPKTDSLDKNMMGTLRTLGQSMFENIQAIERVFQQDQRQPGGSVDNLSRNLLIGKGQVTAMAALKELRKISNILSEM